MMHPIRTTFLLLLLPALLSAQETEGFETRFNAGFTLTDGNSDATLLTLGAETKLATGAREVLSSVRYKYGRTTLTNKDGSETERTNVDNATAKGQGNLFFSEMSYAFVNAMAERDEIANLDYRFLGGPGIGYYFVRNDVWNLSAEAGLVYVTESEQDNEDNYASFRLAQRYERDLNESTRVWQSVEYIPQVEDAELYLLNAELGVSAKLSEKLALTVSGVNKYDSEPARRADENDFTLVAGITYTL